MTELSPSTAAEDIYRVLTSYQPEGSTFRACSQVSEHFCIWQGQETTASRASSPALSASRKVGRHVRPFAVRVACGCLSAEPLICVLPVLISLYEHLLPGFPLKCSLFPDIL